MFSLLASLLLSAPLMAATFQCPTTQGPVLLDTDTGAVNGAATHGTSELRMQRVAHEPAFEIVGDTHGTSRAKVVIAGNPLNPKVRYVEGAKASACKVRGDSEALYDGLVDDPVMLQILNTFRTWKVSRPGPCNALFDSVLYFPAHPLSEKIAIVFHGYSINPVSMQPEMRMLLDAGYTVLAPRLSGHFDRDYLDLANVRATQWEQDAETMLKIVRQANRKVIVLGYSLGGTLGGLLALEHPDVVRRLVVFAPAWRVSTLTSAGVFFGYNSSLNEYEHHAPECNLSYNYSPGAAGQQVEYLSNLVEQRYGGTFPGIINSAFASIRVPTMVWTTQNDQAVDSDFVQQICADFTRNSGTCLNRQIAGRTHSNIIDGLGAQTADGRTVADLILEFLAPAR